MSKNKKVEHWHRLEFWPEDDPSKRMAVAGKFYDNWEAADNAAGAFNRRFQKEGLDKKFKFEACEHVPKGFPFTEEGGMPNVH